jgi:hypothetical protein
MGDEELPPEPEAPPPETEEPEEPGPPVLEPEAALQLFQTGHQIAKVGEPPDQWVSMGRTGEGVAVWQTPMTQEIIDAIKDGQYYLVK